MAFVLRTHEHAEVEVERGCGDGEIVGGDHRTKAAQTCEDVGPALGDLAAELHDGKPRYQGIYAPLSSNGTRWVIGEPYSDQELCVDDGRNHGILVAERSQRCLPVVLRPLELNQRARIDD
jgi:hypothetical protein